MASLLGGDVLQATSEQAEQEEMQAGGGISSCLLDWVDILDPRASIIFIFIWRGNGNDLFSFSPSKKSTTYHSCFYLTNRKHTKHQPSLPTAQICQKKAEEPISARKLSEEVRLSKVSRWDTLSHDRNRCRRPKTPTPTMSSRRIFGVTGS